MEKETRDAALGRIFDDPSFHFFSIGDTNASCAGAACVEHSSGVFRHEEPVNVCVSCMYTWYLYTIPRSALHKNGKFLFAGR